MRIEIGLVEDVTVDMASVIKFKLEEALQPEMKYSLAIEITRKDGKNILGFNVPMFEDVQDVINFTSNFSFLAGQIVFQELTIARLTPKKENSENTEEKV